MSHDHRKQSAHTKFIGSHDLQEERIWRFLCHEDDPTPYFRYYDILEPPVSEQDTSAAQLVNGLTEPTPLEPSNPTISSSTSSPTEDDSDSGFSPITSQVGSEVGYDSLSPESATRVADEALVEGLMSWVRSWLKERLYSPSGQIAVGDSSGTVSSSPDASSGSASKRRRIDTESSGGKEGKVGHGGSPESQRNAEHRSNDRDDAENDQGEKKDKSSQPSDNLRLIACPFYKRNPRKYGQPEWRSCKSPGFKSLHRLKEHIYRRHRKPRYQCKRCQDDLKKEDALDLHYAQAVACQPRPAIIQDGINDTQERSIRSRKLAKKNETEEEKWCRMYAIIFPDDTDCPNPYYSPEDESKEFDLVDEYRSFLARELPPLVRRQLPDILSSDPGNELREQIVSMVGVLANQLYDTFRSEVGHLASQETPQTSMEHATDEFQVPSQSTETIPDPDLPQVPEGPEQAPLQAMQIDNMEVPPGPQFDFLHGAAGPGFDWASFFNFNEDIDETNDLQNKD
ncbi:hypothetical protein B0J13DRAFT_644997 [Dactylonectria estremocensis]|uniref:C2H2-type domain-containing protein n=1 Tax=Dactylonectria estremocensis TaxID=1079267 RepID=A0A9P9IT05_9HYPO|nr:hypothetical protein B0J13DRAFT_644997 [Dactylonectria estremocensis]